MNVERPDRAPSHRVQRVGVNCKRSALSRG